MSGCLDCEDRSLGCHNECSDYQARSILNNMVKVKRYKDNEVHNHVMVGVNRSVDKHIKLRKRGLR